MVLYDEIIILYDSRYPTFRSFPLYSWIAAATAEVEDRIFNLCQIQGDDSLAAVGSPSSRFFLPSFPLH